MAVILNPLLLSKNIDIDPTPPDAPVTKTGNWLWGVLFASSLCTANAAVNPAVPNIIACFSEIFAGIFSTHLAGTFTYSDKPPYLSMPRGLAITITLSPTLILLLLDL